VGVVTLEQVAQMALGLPEAVEADRRGSRTWSVRTKTFAWERPLTKADIKRYGDTPPPAGDLVAVRVADLEEKEAVLASGHRGFFTMAHFDGFPAVLVELDRAGAKAVRELLVDGWLTCAPDQLARAYAEEQGLGGQGRP
jgi:hypothetical protein